MLSLSGLRWRGDGARDVFGNDPGMDFGVIFLRPLRFSVLSLMFKYILLMLSLLPTGIAAILCRRICSRVWRSGIMFRRYTVTLESIGAQLKIFAKACRKRCGASEKIISGLPRAERQKSRQRRRRYFLTPALLVRDLGCRAVEFCQVNGEFFVVRLSAIAQHA